LFSVIIAAALTLLFACNSKQTADQYLQDEHHRKDIVLAMVHHPSYRTEMMHEMMNNDSCKQLMGQSMMSDQGMMKMMMNNPEMMNNMTSDSSMVHNMMNRNRTMQNNMMDQMMDMAEKDSAMCITMMQMMKDRPQINQRMIEMNMSNTKNK